MEFTQNNRSGNTQQHLDVLLKNEIVKMNHDETQRLICIGANPNATVNNIPIFLYHNYINGDCTHISNSKYVYNVISFIHDVSRT